MKYLKPGQDFSASDFASSGFGFTGSADTPTRGPGGPQAYAKGGMAKPMGGAHKISVTPQKAVGALKAAAAMGAIAGAKAASRPAMGPALGPAISAPPPMGAPGAMPGMKKGGRFKARRYADGGPAMDEDDGAPLQRGNAPVPTPRPGRPLERQGKFGAQNPGWVSVSGDTDGSPSTKFGDLPARYADDHTPLRKAKGGFIKGAISKPGRMTKLAKEHGVSTHQEMERDKHSPNPSLRSAANLGLRLTGGDLSPRKRKG